MGRDLVPGAIRRLRMVHLQRILATVIGERDHSEIDATIVKPVQARGGGLGVEEELLVPIAEHLCHIFGHFDTQTAVFAVMVPTNPRFIGRTPIDMTGPFACPGALTFTEVPQPQSPTAREIVRIAREMVLSLACMARLT